MNTYDKDANPMKKYILPVFLLLLVITFMSPGSLAIYSQQREARGRLYTRIFLFNSSEKSTSYNLGLSGLALAPGIGEKELYRFDLTNTSGSSEVSDYNISVNISSSGMSRATSAMAGLVFRLYHVTSESGSPIASVSSGELSHGGLIFPAGIKKTNQYKLTAEWADNGDRAAQTAVASSGTKYAVGLTVTATGID